MANIKFSRKEFEREIGKLDDKMQNQIAMFGTTLESFNNEEIELEIFPNRPDILSYHGFKRGFLGFLGKTRGLKQYKLNKPEKDYFVKIDSSVKDIRPFTACAIVKGLKFNDNKIKEIIDIQEKLHNTVGRKRKKAAIGIYPLEHIKLPITFKAMEPDKIKFIPLESEKEMSGLEILQRHPAGRDYAHLLAGKTKFPIFVDAENNVLSMPPIINSEKTGRITEKTKEIFIECSGFDFEILKKIINIITTALADMGGKVYQMELRGLGETTPNLTSQKGILNLENANKLLGLNLQEKEAKNLLEKMGHDYDLKTKQVLSPAWRTDILHEVDLIEDIAIAYGYENFSPEIPKISTIGEENPREKIKRKIAEILSGAEYIEVSNYHLTTKKDQCEKMGINEKQAIDFIEVEESKTEYNILRQTLSHFLMKNLSENVDASYPQKVFETGKIFNLKNNEIIEKENISIANSPGNFTELKQTVQYLFRMLGIFDKLSFKESEEIKAWFIDGRTADVLFNNEKIGQIGEVHPKILKNIKTKMPISILELSLEEIFNELI